MCRRRSPSLGFSIPRPHQRQPAYQHDGAPGEESEIPGQQIGRVLLDVVYLQNVVIDDTLDYVERAPADQQPAYQQHRGPTDVGQPSGTPQQSKPYGCAYVSGGVKEPVPDGVQLEVSDRVRRVARAGEHVVPLQNLVQYDAVEEAAEAHPE